MQTDLFELLVLIVAVLVPNDFQNGTKNDLESIKKAIQNDLRSSIDFLIDFVHLGSLLGPFWRHWGPFGC